MHVLTKANYWRAPLVTCCAGGYGGYVENIAMVEAGGLLLYSQARAAQCKGAMQDSIQTPCDL